MISKLNEKICKPTQKIKCNTSMNSPKSSQSLLFTLFTLLCRYMFPFILGSVFINPFVGSVSIFYPFAQFVPYFHIFSEYLTEITVYDYVLMYGGLAVMIGYYYYVFRSVGAFVFLQIIPSIAISTAMYLAGTNLSWGIILLIVNVIVTIYVDLTLIKYVRKNKETKK